MIIAGAGGHAREIWAVFSKLNHTEDIYFFDDSGNPDKNIVLLSCPVLSDEIMTRKVLRISPLFILGTGGPRLRQVLSDKLKHYGGRLQSIISQSAIIGQNDVNLGRGLNVMEGVIIYNCVTIGEGTLINTASSIHHDVKIGKYTEICPGARILGNVTIGDYAFIGANAVVLPGVSIGDKAVVGAGAVVTQDIPENETWVGVPARKRKP